MRRLLDPEERFRRLVEAKVGEWANTSQVALPFEQAAQHLGYVRLWDFIKPTSDIEKREQRLQGIEAATFIYREMQRIGAGSITTASFFANILEQSARDSDLADHEVAQTLTLVAGAIAKKMRGEHGITTLHREVVADELLTDLQPEKEFPEALAIIASWNKFKKFAELLRLQLIQESRDALSALRTE